MRLEGLIWGELEELYGRAVKLSGFTETREGLQDSKLGAWSRQARPGRFDLRIGHGHLNLVPAMLLVGRGEIVSESGYYLNQQYHLIASSGVSWQSVSIPRYLQVTKVPGANPYSFAIQEKCSSGRRFLPRFPASNSQQRRIITNLYWNTYANFADIMARDQGVAITMSKNSETFPGFFLERLERWLSAAGQTRVKTVTKGEAQRLHAGYLQDREVVGRVLDRIKQAGWLKESGISTGLFFKHFGHTDLVYSPEGRFFLPLWTMGVLPQFYGAAYWVWNVLMHSASQSPPWAIQEVEKWREAFEARAPRELKTLFYQGFYLNLLERATTALLVDIPLKRSPFDRLKNHRRTNARKIFLAVLRQIHAKI